jgi:hypothetical protein
LGNSNRTGADLSTVRPARKTLGHEKKLQASCHRSLRAIPEENKQASVPGFRELGKSIPKQGTFYGTSRLIY